MHGHPATSIDDFLDEPRTVAFVCRESALPVRLRRVRDFLEARWPNIVLLTVGDEQQIGDLLHSNPPDLLLFTEAGSVDRVIDRFSQELSGRKFPSRTLVARIRKDESIESLSISLPKLNNGDCLGGRVIDLLERRARSRASRSFRKFQIDRLARKNERLRQLSVEDPLTRVFNRRGFQRFFHTEWSRASRYEADVACVMVDIDNFKRLNDTYGHAVGDHVLRRFADLLRSSCRTSDILGRIGGEEFCIVLPACNEHQAVLWAEKTRQRIASTPLHAQTTALRITASFGIASAQASMRDEHELIDMADKAMLVAKHGGRNRVVAASSINGDTLPQRKLSPASRIIRLLLDSLAIRDPSVAHHSQRVSQYSTLLAKHLGLAENEVWVTEVGGLLHDLGKMGLPDAILQKPTALEPDERQLVDQSLASSHDFVRHAFGDGPLAETVRCSRIWYRDAHANSSRVPVSARIVAIADAYDSMTTTQSYRQGITRTEAAAELLRCGDQFDTDLVKEFTTLLDVSG